MHFTSDKSNTIRLAMFHRYSLATQDGFYCGDLNLLLIMSYEYKIAKQYIYKYREELASHSFFNLTSRRDIETPYIIIIQLWCSFLVVKMYWYRNRLHPLMLRSYRVSVRCSAHYKKARKAPNSIIASLLWCFVNGWHKMMLFSMINVHEMPANARTPYRRYDCQVLFRQAISQDCKHQRNEKK